MKKYAGYKLKEIIDKEFDMRISMAVVRYIMDRGWDNVKTITEEQISQVEGNGLMTADFVQALVRCAVRVCKECDPIDDFLPFVINYLVVPGANTREINIMKEDVSKYFWEKLLAEFDLDCFYEEPEKIEEITINANVLSVFKTD